MRCKQRTCEPFEFGKRFRCSFETKADTQASFRMGKEACVPAKPLINGGESKVHRQRTVARA